MKYQIVAVVDAENLGAAITAIQPHLSDPLQVAPVTPPPVSETIPATRRERRDRPQSQTPAGMAVVELLRTGPCSIREIGEHLATINLSPNTASPVVSKLQQEGLAERFFTSLNGVRTAMAKLRAPAAA